MEPIIIHLYNEEAERGDPVTNEDMERGHLEEGWILTGEFHNFWVTHISETDATRTVRSLGREYELRQTAGGWAINWWGRLSNCPAMKVRLSADEVVGVPTRVEDLQPGMVFMGGGSIFVCLTERYVRIIGTETKVNWTAWPLEKEVTVCCTRPSMQFILK